LVKRLLAEQESPAGERFVPVGEIDFVVPDRELEALQKAVGLQALGIGSPFGSRKARDSAHIKRTEESLQG
jgi:hypothetical protein